MYKFTKGINYSYYSILTNAIAFNFYNDGWGMKDISKDKYF